MLLERIYYHEACVKVKVEIFRMIEGLYLSNRLFVLREQNTECQSVLSISLAR